MRKTAEIVWVAASAVLLAIAIFVILAAPGFLSDVSSTIPVGLASQVSRGTPIRTHIPARVL